MKSMKTMPLYQGSILTCHLCLEMYLWNMVCTVPAHFVCSTALDYNISTFKMFGVLMKVCNRWLTSTPCDHVYSKLVSWCRVQTPRCIATRNWACHHWIKETRIRYVMSRDNIWFDSEVDDLNSTEWMKKMVKISTTMGLGTLFF